MSKIKINLEEAEYRKDYLREGLKSLRGESKPLIITAAISIPNDYAARGFIAFRNPRPANPMTLTTEGRPLCDHFSVGLDEIQSYLPGYLDDVYNGKEYFLCVRVYTYESNGIERLSLRLTDELGVNPIEDLLIRFRKVYRDCIDWDQYFDRLKQDRYVKDVVIRKREKREMMDKRGKNRKRRQKLDAWMQENKIGPYSYQARKRK